MSAGPFVDAGAGESANRGTAVVSGAAPVSQGRVWVTGASRGIGRAVAEALLARGARVVVTARDAKRLLELRDGAGDRVHVLAADLEEAARRPELLAALVEEAWSAFGGLDGFVSAAGMVRYERYDEIALESLETQHRVNFIAPFFLLQGVARRMLAARMEDAQMESAEGPSVGTNAPGQKSIVLVSSTLSTHPAPATAVYAASKAALEAAARSVARELAPSGVRLNAVAPGLVDTEMIRHSRPAAEGEGAMTLTALGALPLMGRLAESREIADAILYLLDATYVTGTVLTVDGGLTLR